MRHIRSILYALVLAPAAWVLTGVGLTGDLTARGRDGFAVENVAGLLLLLLAGAAYGILVLAPISPAGPLLAGVGYLSISVWALQTPSAYAAFWPPSVAKDGFDLSRPGYGLAALLAVPLISTALSARRWARYEPPVIPIIGQLGRARGAAAAYGTPLAVAQTTVISGPGLDADPTTVLRLPMVTTSIVPGFGDDPTFALAAATRNGRGAAIDDEPTVATAIEDLTVVVTEEEPTADVPAADVDGELTTGIVSGPDPAADDDPTETVADSGDEPTAVVADEEPAADVADEEPTEAVAGSDDEPTAVVADEEPTSAVVEEETADVVVGAEAVAGDLAAEADSAVVDDASAQDGSDDEPKDDVVAENPGDDEPATEAQQLPGADSGEKTQVIKLPTAPSGDTTQVLRFPGRPGGFGPGERTRDLSTRATGDVGGDETQVIRLDAKAVDEERTQVIRPQLVTPPGERTEVLKFPAPPVPDDPPVSIADAEAPNFAEDPTSPIILPTAAEDDEATEPGRRVMTVMNLERPPDEIADDTTHIEIPTQRRPSDDEA